MHRPPRAPVAGGTLVGGIGVRLLVATLDLWGDQSGEAMLGWGMILYGPLPFLPARLILLIGGFVRWGQARA